MVIVYIQSILLVLLVSHESIVSLLRNTCSINAGKRGNVHRVITQYRELHLVLEFWFYTVVPHLTRIIRSVEIAVKQNPRHVKRKSPLKCI